MFKALVMKGLGLAAAGTIAVGAAGGELSNMLASAAEQVTHQGSAGAVVNRQAPPDLPAGADPSSQAGAVPGQSSEEHRSGGGPAASPSRQAPGGGDGGATSRGPNANADHDDGAPGADDHGQDVPTGHDDGSSPHAASGQNTPSSHDGNGSQHAADDGQNPHANRNGGHGHDADADGGADDGVNNRPQNHGFFVSEVARGVTTTVAIPAVTLPANPKNHGESVRSVAQSAAGKTQGAASSQGATHGGGKGQGKKK